MSLSQPPTMELEGGRWHAKVQKGAEPHPSTTDEVGTGGGGEPHSRSSQRPTSSPRHVVYDYHPHTMTRRRKDDDDKGHHNHNTHRSHRSSTTSIKLRLGLGRDRDRSPRRGHSHGGNRDGHRWAVARGEPAPPSDVTGADTNKPLRSTQTVTGVGQSKH